MRETAQAVEQYNGVCKLPQPHWSRRDDYGFCFVSYIEVVNISKTSSAVVEGSKNKMLRRH